MAKTIGIDLGTTYSAMAVIGPSGKPEILTNSEGQNITPSVVLFPETKNVEEPMVGDMAKRSAVKFPLDVVQYVKRQIGNPDWRFESSNGNTYTAEEVSAIILKRLKQDAELMLGETVDSAVITVPAYFDDVRRTATKQAGKIAGLNVLRILNEPTAAALSYGLDTQTNGTVLVYDLGGGTFDVTLMRIDNSEFDVLATDGNRNLGGFDFDNRIAEYIISELESEGLTDVETNDELVAEICEKAELAKRSLSMVAQTTVIISAGNKTFRIKITRDKFEELTIDLVNQTRELVEIVLDEAGLGWSQVDHLLLVGGSTRMPMIKNMIESISGKEVVRDINPDEAVALGAAIQAALSSDKSESGALIPLPDIGGNQIVISDVTSQSLGVVLIDEYCREYNNVVIPRNSKIPCKYSTQVGTVVPHQKEVRVCVTQGDDKEIEYVTIIGEQLLKIPEYPEVNAPFTISYAYDIDQTVFIEVFDNTANRLVGTFEIDRQTNLTDSEVDKATDKLKGIAIS